MARYKYTKDGRKVEHKGGRPTKAKQMGLPDKFEKAFKKVSAGKSSAHGAQVVIDEMVRIALDPNHSKQYDALKWVTDRYFGKEPKAIIQETNVEIGASANLKELLQYNETKTIDLDYEEDSSDQRNLPPAFDE